MLKWLILLTVVLGLCPRGWAETASDVREKVSLTEEQIAGRQALIDFRDTEPYLTPRTEEYANYQTFGSVCSWLSAACSAYIRNNRALVLRALPDNPLYWQNFWIALEKSQPYFDPEEYLPGGKTVGAGSDLIEASNNWPLYDLATTGEVSVVRAIKFLDLSQRLAQTSAVLIDKMISMAMVGIGQNIAHRVLWQMGGHAAEADFVRLTQLLKRSDDLTSMRLSFGNELELSAHAAHRDPEEILSLLGEGNSIDTFLEEYRLFVAVWSDVSERNFADFWSQGIDILASERIQQPLFVMGASNTWAPSMASYITTAHQTSVYARVILALADIYRGRVAPGLPARPDPSPWQWVWGEDPEQLCLVPVSVHASFAVEDACVDYLGLSSD